MTESQLKSLILEFLNEHPAVDIAIPYHQVQANKKIRRSKYQPKGIPDVVGAFRNGVCMWVEVKLPSGKVSPEQDQFIVSRLSRNQVAFVARSVEDCAIAIRNFGY